MFAMDLVRAASRLKRAVVAVALIGVAASSVSVGQTKTCFPSCDPTDGRFLSLVGSNLESLSGDIIVFSFRVPANASAFNLDLFDGETGGIWDKGTNPIIYEVFADPDNDGQIEAGEAAYGPYSGATMSDNAWSGVSIPTSNAARLGTTGPYFYTLRAKLQDPSVANTWSNFKLRANADILLQTNNFSFAAPLFTTAEANIIYPSFNGTSSPASLANPRYDGTWRYFMIVEKSTVFGTRPDTAFVDIWDGDMDFGSYDCSALDVDDPNTPNLPFTPPWAVGTTAVTEGVPITSELCRDAGGAILAGTATSTGDPSDDNLSLFYRRSPSVNYVILAPDGAIYTNTNPSGSKEWERFSASLTGGVPMVHDIAASAIPDGIYEVRIIGMDMNNLNAWHSTFRFVGVCENGVPCHQDPECQTCPTCRGVTATKGYWKIHPEAWPVSSLVIGGQTRDKATLMAWLAAEGTDNFNIVASQLVASMLNVANDAEDDCIASTIASASAWIGTYESARPIGSGAAWTIAAPLAAKLDDYNNGALCAPHRDDVECETAGGKAKGKKNGSSKLR
jgi:hypothetical protein